MLTPETNTTPIVTQLNLNNVKEKKNVCDR